MAEKALQQFRQSLAQMKGYEEALGVLYWDLRTGAPRKGMESRNEAIGVLSAELFRLSTSEQMGEWLSELEQPEAYAQLGRIDQVLVRECRKEYDRNCKIPAQLHKEYVILASEAEGKWEVAKEQDDYEGFKPYLARIIAFQNQFIDLWGVKAARYDTLLDQYEPGMTTAELDHVFGGLRNALVPLVAAVADSRHRIDTGFLQQPYQVEAQKRFSTFILGQMGFDFQAGRLDESAHPFATGLNPGDVRITTRYLPNDVMSALFGSIHEGGHALYEQNISLDLQGTPLCTGTTMAIHESQSRFWENVIGRSRPFWERYYPDLQRHFPGQLGVGVVQFYEAINSVQPSLIRTEADELTYNLHIIIRYEIEKMIFNEGATADDLPAIWNDKYKEYLGVVPGNYREGVLQDVHWPSGAFGYFPSYSLGNMYAAQFTQTLEAEIPNLWQLVGAGDLHPIKDWLAGKIYTYGKLETPAEIVQRVTGKPLDSSYLTAYFQEKYGAIYRL